MDRFNRPRRGWVAVAAIMIGLLWGGTATAAEDQAKRPAPATAAQPEGQPSVQPPVQPKAPAAAKPLAPVIAPKKEAEGILGKQVYGVNGADMGLVTNVLVDRAGNPIAVVIDFGGFLGMGIRKIAIDWHLMRFHPGNKDKPVTLSLEKGQLKAAPTYDPDKPPRIVGTSAAPTPAKPATPPTAAQPAKSPTPTATKPSPPAAVTPPTPTPAPAAKDHPGK